MRRATVAWMTALALCAGCGGGDEPSGHRDPLTGDPAAGLLAVVDVVTRPVAGAGANEVWGVERIGDCLYVWSTDASGQTASSDCSGLPNDTSTRVDGGLHDGVSIAWVTSADDQVDAAQFVLADGTVVDAAPLDLRLAEQLDQPAVFAHATVASNEIVGVELYDTGGDLVMAVPIDGDA